MTAPEKKTAQEHEAEKPKTSPKRENVETSDKLSKRKRITKKAYVPKAGSVDRQFQVSEKSRKTVTWTCGMYSSILAARIHDVELAAKEANLLAGILRSEVFSMSLVRAITFQLASIVMRIVSRGEHSVELQQHVYNALLHAPRGGMVDFDITADNVSMQYIDHHELGQSTSCGQKLWIWLIYCVMEYRNTAVEKRNKLQRVQRNQVSTPRLDREGLITNPYELVARPDDRSISSLVVFYKSGASYP